MVYGVPAVIGAKKGFPNFNEFAMQTQVQVTRKLQFRRPDGSSVLPVNQTNQMFVVTISNLFGVEAWNSYGTNFPRDLRMTVLPDVTVTLTNEAGILLVAQRFAPPVAVTNIPAGAWPGYDMAASNTPSNSPSSPMCSSWATRFIRPSGQLFIPLTGVFEAASPAFYVPALVAHRADAAPGYPD